MLLNLRPKIWISSEVCRTRELPVKKFEIALLRRVEKGRWGNSHIVIVQQAQAVFHLDI